MIISFQLKQPQNTHAIVLIQLWHPPSIRQLIACQGQLGHVQKIAMQIFNSIPKVNIIFPETGFNLCQNFITVSSLWKMGFLRGLFLHSSSLLPISMAVFSTHCKGFSEAAAKNCSLLCAWYICLHDCSKDRLIMSDSTLLPMGLGQ